MSKGVFEEMVECLKRMEAKVDQLQASTGARAAQVRVASIADLAARYSVAKATIRTLLHQMAAAGFEVQTSKFGIEWRVNVEEFDAAYDKLFSRQFAGL